MIKPTVGRVVWYYGSKALVVHQALAAIVAFVESDEKVNLLVVGGSGDCFPRQRVRLVQDLEDSKASDNLPDGEFCTWMPFQKAAPAVAQGVEARLAALEAQVEALKLTQVKPIELGPDGKPVLWVPPGNPGNPLPKVDGLSVPQVTK